MMALTGGYMTTLLKNALYTQSDILKGRGILISGFQVLFNFFKNYIITNCKSAVYDMNGLFIFQTTQMRYLHLC